MLKISEKTVFYWDFKHRLEENMKSKYRHPMRISFEELAFKFFSDYVKRGLNDKQDVDYMIKMLEQVFL